MPALGDNNKTVGRPSLEVWVGYGGEKASQNAPSQAPEVGGKLGKDAKGKNVEWLPGQDQPPASRQQHLPHQRVIFSTQTFQPHPSLSGQTPLAPHRQTPASPAPLGELPEARSCSADTPWWKQLITRGGKCARTLA